MSDSSIALLVAPRLLLDCLRHRLLCAGWLISAASSEGSDARAEVLSCAPRVVLVSLYLPPVGGLHTIAALTDARADLRIVALLNSVSADDASSALRAGALSWISTEYDWEAGQRTLRAAEVGDVLFGGNPPSARGDRVLQPILSRREFQVLTLVHHGRTVKQIAAELVISPKTVKHHLVSIHTKLGVHNRTDAIVQALRRGLLGTTPLDPSVTANQASG
ncbi:MAG: LuxR C-terminal-related transcriptional regulator [Ilumatobacteraceae bacterium]